MGPIAQSVEQRTFNPWVDGSSPSGPTSPINYGQLSPLWARSCTRSSVGDLSRLTFFEFQRKRPHTGRTLSNRGSPRNERVCALRATAESVSHLYAGGLIV